VKYSSHLVWRVWKRTKCWEQDILVRGSYDTRKLEETSDIVLRPRVGDIQGGHAKSSQ